MVYILPSLPNRRDGSHSLQLWTEFSLAIRTIVLGLFGTSSAEVIRSHGIFQTLRSCCLRKLREGPYDPTICYMFRKGRILGNIDLLLFYPSDPQKVSHTVTAVVL